jgi:4-hydroxybenzoate polyprenyltransferase
MSSETRNLPVHPDGDASLYRKFAASLLALGERTKDVLVYTSTYLVFIAMVEVATVMIALSLRPNPAPLVVGLVTFAVYVGDRIADAETDELSNPKQSAFVTRHRRLLSVLSAVAYGLAIAVSIAGGPIALAITLLPGAFWVLYASDWLPTVGSQFKRLKEVLVVNSALVAFAWAVAVVVLPMAFADAALTPTAVVVFVYFFVDTFVNTEIPNVRDRAGDAAIGVSTLPVVFGVRRTRHILYALDLLLAAFLAGAFLQGLLSVALAAAVLAGLGYALVLAAFVGRTDRYGRLSIAGEAKHLLVAAVVVGLGVGGV